MQAGAPNADTRGMETAPRRPDREAPGSDGGSSNPHGLHKPPRPDPFLALAPAPADAAHLDLSADLRHARELVAAAEDFRNPIDPEQLAKATGRAALRVPSREGVEAVQLEAFNVSLAVACEDASVAFHSEDGWLDAIRAGLAALLAFFDAEPELARFLVVHSAQAGDRVCDRRAEVMYRISVLLDDERAPARIFPPPLTAQAVASGALGVLHERLARRSRSPLSALAGELMSFIVLPFLGFRAARRELDSTRDGATAEADVAVLDLVRDTAGRLTPRTVSVLLAAGAEPGLNSRALAERAGVRDEGHASRLLSRLERLGLIENARDPGSRFAPKAWRLAAAGVKLVASLERPAPEAVSAFELPSHLVGRLDDSAVSLLLAVGEQRWLRTSEAAERAGVSAGAHPARLLQSLVDLGLALGELETHTRGTPRVWCLTPAGERLHATLTGETAPPRAVASELMHASGGRLTAPSIMVLRLLGSEPGLSNSDIAARLGFTDENSVSQLLARLARRDLIVNTRERGKRNVWCLTPTGETLERAIWAETPEPQQRTLALDLLRGRGGRLNHRVVFLLRVIAADPGLSNAEIAKRAGVVGKGHASTLLARLARFALVENLVVDPEPFEANAWRLTANGRELEAATRTDRHAASPTRPGGARHGITTRGRR
jgi:DNA-binding MarR family transcriptional regulator